MKWMCQHKNRYNFYQLYKSIMIVVIKSIVKFSQPKDLPIARILLGIYLVKELAC